MSEPSRLSRAEARVIEWFYTPASVAPLAFVRFGLGLVLVLSVASYLPHAEWLWGEDGFSANTFSSYAQHPLRYHTELILGLLLVSSACFAVGFATRWTGLLAAVLQAVTGSTGYVHTWGWSTVMPVVVAIVALSAAGNRWSVDAWLAARKGRTLPAVAPAWALRLLQVHVAVVYVSASWHRYNDPGWINGEMVYAAVANGMYTRLPYLDPQPFQGLFIFLTYATELIEMVAPVLLWVKRVRTPLVIGLMGLHLGLELSAIIGWWQPMMLTLLVVFLPPGWSARVLDRLKLPVSGTTQPD